MLPIENPSHVLQTMRFACDMAKELDANAPKKGPFWKWRPTPSHLMSEIDHHKKKLEEAILKGEKALVSEYAADLANYAMKAHYMYGLPT